MTQEERMAIEGDLRYVLTPELEQRVSVIFRAIEIVQLHQLEIPHDLCDLHKVLAETLCERKGSAR